MDTKSQAAELFVEARNHMDGIGMQVDLKKAFDLTRNSADLGCPRAQFYMHQFYDTGVFVTANMSEHMRWLKLAADSGHSAAMSIYGHYLLWGVEGLTRNEPEGFFWIERGAAVGIEQAKQTLAHPRARGRRTAQVHPGPRTGQWISDPNTGPEHWVTSYDYADGIGVAPDLTKRFESMLRAALLGVVDAMESLVRCYGVGEGTSIDPKSSVEWLSRAADAKNSLAMGKLGEWYLHGAEGLPHDERLGYEWIEKSAELGNPHAMGLLIQRHYANKHTPGDAAKLVEWTQRAAALDDVPGIEMLAFLHMNSLCGLRPDKPMVNRILRKAAMRHAPFASRMLAENDSMPYEMRHGAITPIAMANISDDERTQVLHTFFRGHWGNLLTWQWQENDRNAERGGFLLGLYPLGPGRTMMVVSEDRTSYGISLKEEPGEESARDRWLGWLTGFIMAPM